MPTLQAQIQVSNAPPYNEPDFLVENILLGGCLQVDNIAHIGLPNSIGYFTNGGSLGIEEGLVLTTGNISNIEGPNNQTNASQDWNFPGDADLNDLITPHLTQDKSELTFDFLPLATGAQFQFLFASEEYLEYAISDFANLNDAFGFFINGTNYVNENIALVPNTTLPISVQTINDVNNSAYYINNPEGSPNIEFDGYTTVLTATVDNLVPCEWYSIKLVIADATDGNFDSAVFLAANSFTAGQSVFVDAYVDATNSINAHENCYYGYFTFTRGDTSDLSQPVTFPIIVDGTATAGEDYNPLPSTITIPAGETSVQVDLEVLPDEFLEDLEFVSVQADVLGCDCLPPPPAILNILDEPLPFILIDVPDVLVCLDTEITLSVLPVTVDSIGFEPYEFEWSTTQMTQNIDVTPQFSTTYFVTVTDQCGRTKTADVEVDVVSSGADATIFGDDFLCFTDPPQQYFGAMAGGTWQGPAVGFDTETGTFSPNEAFVNNLLPPYEIIYTIDNDCGQDADTLLIDMSFGDPPTITPVGPFCGAEGIITLEASLPNGVWSGVGIIDENTGEFDTDILSSNASVEVFYTIAGDCGGEASTIIEGSSISATLNTNDVSCFGENSGIIEVNTSDGQAPYTYVWSDSNFSNDSIQNVTQGTYSVTITDNLGCSTSAETTISEPEALSVSVAAENVLCFGEASGSIVLTVSGGTTDYSFAWSDANFANDAVQNNVAAGVYSVTITDANSCEFIEQNIEITEPTEALMTNISTTDIFCENSNNGSISLNVSGGTIPYDFVWSDASLPNDENINNLSGGTYTVTITDDNDCILTAEATINQNAGLELNTQTSPVLCFNEDSGSINLSIVGGQTPYTFVWSDANFANDSIQNNVAAGTYSVTVTDGNNCEATTSLTVDNVAQMSVNISSTDVLCNNTATGSITVSVQNGQGDISYDWGGSLPNTDTHTETVAAGDYTVTVTDENNCMAEASVTINDVLPFSVDIEGTDVSCFGGNNGTINLIINANEDTYTFNWNNNLDGIEDQDNLTAGDYSVTVTNSNNCDSILSITLNEPAEALSLSLNATDAFCNGDTSGSIDVTVTGGTENYTFAWNNGIQTEDQTNIPSGSYTVIATDANGCTETASIEVGQADGLTLSVTTSPALCNGDASGSIDLTVEGGTPDYIYDWLGAFPNNTEDQTDNAAAGTYFVQVTDDNGCTETIEAVVAEADELVVTFDITNVECFGESTGSIDLSVSGGTEAYSFEWNNGLNPTEDQNQNLTAGNYTVTISDTNNCGEILNIPISEADELTLELFPTNAACGQNTGNINVVASGGTGGFLYEWNHDGNLNNANATNLGAGTYTLTVSDQNGCEITQSVTIENEGSPEAEMFVIHPTCLNNNGEAGVVVDENTGTPPYTYEWSAANNDLNFIGGLSAGTYTITITDANDCQLILDAVLELPELPSMSLNTIAPTCGNENGIINVTGSGGQTPYEIAWSNPNIAPNTQVATNLASGAYSITLTDANDCEIIEQVDFQASSSPEITITVSNSSCGQVDGTATATVSGGEPDYTYEWNTTPPQDTPTATGLLAGTYEVTVTDASSCFSVAVANVSDEDAPTASIIIDNEATCEQNNGQLTVSISGGVTPYQILWSNEETTEMINNLSAGTYSVDVTDANGCAVSQSVTLTDNGLPTAFAVATEASCGQTNGQATVTANNGTPPYSFSWSDGITSTDSIAINLAAQEYTITVTDGNDCEFVTTVTVQNADGPSVDLTAENANCGNADGVATALVTGGELPYDYIWSNGTIEIQSENIAGGLPAGTYFLTVTDANDCAITASVEVGENLAPTLSFSTTATTCGLENGDITAIAEGGQAPYTYAWEGLPNTDSTLTNIAAGSYTVTVSDANGCEVTASESVASSDVLDAFIDVLNNATCQEENGTAIAIVNNGQADFTYQWSSGSTTDTATDLGEGTVFCTITDDNGCEAIVQAEILQTSPPSLDASSTPDFCLANVGTATVTATGDGDFTYEWSDDFGQETQTATDLAAGIYIVTVTDANFCTETANVTVSGVDAPTIAGFDTNNSNCGTANGSATVNVQGGTPNYTFLWDTNANSQTTQTAENLAAGSYSVTVTDDNDCEVVGTANISDAGAPTLTIEDVVQPTCNLANGQASVSVSTGGEPYSFEWNDANGQNVGIDATVTNLAAGTYSVVVTDTNDCAVSESVTLVDAGVPQLVGDALDANCGQADGSANVSVINGGTAPFSYAWENLPAETDSFIANVVAGIYTVTVSDINGCENSISIEIGDLAGVELLNISSTNANCDIADGTATVLAQNGTTPYTYLWNDDLGQTTETAINLATGTYTVTVTDDVGCSFEENVTVNTNDAATLSINTTDATCNTANGSIEVIVTGGQTPFEYEWDTPNLDETQTVSDLAAGTYSVTVTDNTGCAISISGNIQTSALPNINDMTSTSDNCGQANGTATVVASGGTPPYAYAWDDGLSQNTQTAENLVSGTYTVIVTDSLGCEATASIFVDETDAPILLNTDSTDENCGKEDGTASVEVSGGIAPYTYEWNDNLNQNTPTADSLAAGTYTVTVTDIVGCLLIVEDIIVNEAALPTVTITSVDANCGSSNGSISASVSAGSEPYTFLWDTPSEDETADVNNLPSGSYSLTVTDVNACEIVATGSISDSDAPTATIITTPTSCEMPEGTAIVTATGGTTPYTYEWNDNTTQTDSIATNLLQGTYEVIITDANGCITIETAEVAGFMLNPVIDCGVSTDTTLTFIWNNVAGATAYAIEIDGVLDTISATQYEVDSLVALQSVSISVTALGEDICGNSEAAFQTCNTVSADCDENPIVLDGLAESYCIGDPEISIIATPEGGTLSGNGINGTSFNPTLAGTGTHTITYTYTDEEDCEWTAEISTLVSEVTVSITPNNSVISEGETVTLTANGSSAVGDSITYIWQNNVTDCIDCQTIEIVVNEDTNFEVLAIDEYGCEASATASVSILFENKYIIPNAFSPNEDQINDYFQVFGYDIENVELYVYNRWGNMVYEYNGAYPMIGWDGIYKGIEQEIGVYVYFGRVTFENKDVEFFKGNVTLIR